MYGISAAPLIAVIIIMIILNRYLRAYRNAGATHRAQATSPEELGLPRRRIFYQLVRKKVLIEASADRFYLDENRISGFIRSRILLTAAAVTLIWIIEFIIWYNL